MGQDVRYATTTIFAVVHAAGDPMALVPSVRAAVQTIEPLLPVYDIRALDDRLGDSLGRRRIATWLIGVFAALAAIGVYGVMSYVAEELRTADCALRS